MPRADYKTCRECRKHVNEIGPLSHTRLCRSCAIALSAENYTGLTTRSGEAFAHWRRSMAASVGATLLDDLKERA
jgi:predicted MarR family transcription regulator